MPPQGRQSMELKLKLQIQILPVSGRMMNEWDYTQRENQYFADFSKYVTLLPSAYPLMCMQPKKQGLTLF